MAKNVLSAELIEQFKDLEQCIIDIAVLSLSQRSDLEDEFAKILLAVGLLEVSTEDQVTLNPLEQ